MVHLSSLIIRWFFRAALILLKVFFEDLDLLPQV